jgi:hypothetical protein
MVTLIHEKYVEERIIFPDLQDQIIKFACSGPFKRVYDSINKKFISIINPNYQLLNNANLYKINNIPTWNYNFDRRNGVKTMNIYFILPLKISQENRYDPKWNVIEDNVKIILMLKSNYYHDIHVHHWTMSCVIIIPNYYYKMTQDYVHGQQRIHLSTPKNIFFWEGILKFNYGYDITI